MALETRNGRIYYYSKKRVNGKVVSVYEGSGYLARLLAAEHEEIRQKTADTRWQHVAELDGLQEVVDETLRTAKAALTAIYIANGYHTHTRTWRRKQT